MVPRRRWTISYLGWMVCSRQLINVWPKRNIDRYRHRSCLKCVEISTLITWALFSLLSAATTTTLSLVATVDKANQPPIHLILQVKVTTHLLPITNITSNNDAHFMLCKYTIVFFFSPLCSSAGSSPYMLSYSSYSRYGWHWLLLLPASQQHVVA